MKIELICRVCLQEGKLKSIFDSYLEKSPTVKCSEMLTMCASVTIDEFDGFPRQICDHCFKNLCSAYKFRRLCEDSFEFLKQYFNEVVSKFDIKEEKLEHQQQNEFDENIIEATIQFEDDIQGAKVKDEWENNDNTIDNFMCDDNDGEIYSINNNDSNLKKKNNRTKKMNRRIKGDFKEKLPKMKLEQREKQILKCQYCPKSFKFKYRLTRHEDTHFAVKRYFCEICQKAYRSEKDHIKFHKRGFQFNCDICGKRFNTKAKVTNHVNTHTANRGKIVCGLEGCTKEFITAGGLKRHRELHDGVRNFVCHVCSKKFLDKYALESHLMRHTNEKKYKCTYCDRRFYQSSGRTAHEKIHTNKRDYLCKECNQAFHTLAGLKRHNLSHTKILTEACRFCDKRFSRKDNKRRHEMVMHGAPAACEGKVDFD